jgi:ASC-1-like (ASCH) protein
MSDDPDDHRHTMTLNDPWFGLVRRGAKSYEGRRATEKIKSVAVGDVIEFRHHTRPEEESTFIAKVISTVTFPTFEHALSALPLAEVLPGVVSVAEGVAVYLRFVSMGTQVADGVVMLKLEVQKTV